MTDHQTKARGLYQLYRDEKKHEEKTRKMLTELERNNEQLFDSKLRLVEMLLDVQVKDELARQAEADETNMPQLNAELIRENARKRMQTEVRAHSAESRQMFEDGFMSHLDRLVRQDEDEAKKEIRTTVDRYVEPHLEQLRRERRRRPDGPLESVARAANEVAARRRTELKEQQHMRARVDHSDRARRVEQALALLKRDIGDLTPLLHVAPVDYKTDIGRREAEENDLRQLIARQRAEEERLIQERQVTQAVIEAEQAKLAADVDGACQQLVLLQRELETKEMDLKEMAAAQIPGSGTWATSTMQLEKDLALAIEEEYHLKHDTTEIAHKNDLLQTERAALDGEIAQSIDDLTRTQMEYQEIMNQIEAKLTAAKQKMYRLRDDEVEMTHKINDHMYRILHRREDVRQQKRDLRASINTIISQISVEDRVQSALTARALELQTQAEKARGSMEHDIATFNSQLVRINQELKNKSALISQNVETLTNFFAASGRVNEVKLTGIQLQTQIDQLVKEWSRVEWEAASSVAQVAARVDHTRRENDRVLRQIGRYVIVQEDISEEGVDLVKSTNAELVQIQESLYAESSMRAYREAKYTQSTKLLRDRLQLRARGDRSIMPLTASKHVSLRDRRARREAANRSRQARDLALQHVRNFSLTTGEPGVNVTPMGAPRSGHIRDYFGMGTDASSMRSPSSFTGGGSVSIGGAGSERAALDHPEFRRLVIDFIKKEIQPLYDSSQITKKRFVDVVARVSTWFLDTHRPTTDLSEQNLNELTKAIQEVLTWQDEQRLGARQS
jgi:hypothetical protein